MPIREPLARPADDLAGDPVAAGVTVGVTGRPVRATVSACGDVTPWAAGGAWRWWRSGARSDPAPTLSWYVAADDRWHVPAAEPTVRQRRIGGAPVVETRLRVPDGDAVQRVWSVADGGGLTVVEVANDSPLPFAVAFAGAAVRTQRPPADVPPRGIELPADAIVLPVGHHASIMVGLSIDPGSGRLTSGALSAVPSADAVGRGWMTITEGASRLEIPDTPLVEAMTAARCDLLLEGPVDGGADPVGFLLDVGELVRLGDDASAWLPEIVGPAEAIARRMDGDTAVGLAAAAGVALAAGDRRAAGDLDRLLRRRAAGPPPAPGRFADVARAASAGRFARHVESLFASSGALLSAGLPTPWEGHGLAVHGIPTGPESTVSYAIRWHGDRPAVLWEQTGPVVTLTSPALAPAWTSNERAGEALWPPRPRRSSLRVSAD